MTKGGIGAALFRPRWMRDQEQRDRARGAASFSPSSASAVAGDDAADKLPYGQQRLLEVARALAAKPRLLLLDEPAAGLNMPMRPRRSPT